MKELEQWEGIPLSDAAKKTDKTENELLQISARDGLDAWIWVEALLTTAGIKEKGWLKVPVPAIKKLIDSEAVFVGNFVTPDGRDVFYASESYEYDPTDRDYSSYDDMMKKVRYENDYNRALRIGMTVLPKPELYFDPTYKERELLINREHLRFFPVEIARIGNERVVLKEKQEPLPENIGVIKKDSTPDDTWKKVITWAKIAEFMKVSISTAKSHTKGKRINKRNIIKDGKSGGTKVWAYENDLNEIKNRPAKKMKKIKVNYFK